MKLINLFLIICWYFLNKVVSAVSNNTGLALCSLMRETCSGCTDDSNYISPFNVGSSTDNWWKCEDSTNEIRSGFDPCDRNWNGVICSGENVVSLNLYNKQLTGKIKC